MKNKSLVSITASAVIPTQIRGQVELPIQTVWALWKLLWSDRHMKNKSLVSITASAVIPTQIRGQVELPIQTVWALWKFVVSLLELELAIKNIA